MVSRRDSRQARSTAGVGVVDMRERDMELQAISTTRGSGKADAQMRFRNSPGRIGNWGNDSIIAAIVVAEVDGEET